MRSNYAMEHKAIIMVVLKNNEADFLPTRLRTILEMRIGVNGYKQYTLKEIGQHIGVNTERVRQLEARAVSIIKKGYEGQTKAKCKFTKPYQWGKIREDNA